MEKPTIKKLDGNIWAIGVVVYGELTKPERKALGDQVYDEVLALPEVKDLNLYGAGTYEISIEVKEDRLRELNLTLSEVANAVRVSSLDLPAGIIRSEAGNVLIRTEGKAYVGQDFKNIVLRSQVDGTQLLLSDVAEVRDGFTDTVFLNHFDRDTAVTLAISSLEGQNVLAISEAIHRINTEADVIWVDGHSDYGHAFEVFWDKYGKEINPKSTVLLLGDARNNYHASQAWVIKEIRQKARHVYWLNPEPRSYWNTGDSIVGEYGTHTDGVYECRNLRQLEAFVEKLA